MKKCLILLVLFSQNYNKLIAQTPALEWSENYGGLGNLVTGTIVTDADDNLYSAGVFTNSVDVDPGIAVLELVSTGDQDFFIQKLNSDGTLAWVKSFGGPYIDQINDISIDSQGNLIGCGVFYDSIIFDSSVPTAYSSGLSDIFIIKLDLNGNFMWVKTYGSPNLETAYTLDLDTMDNIYLTGHFKTPLDFNPGTGYDSLYTFHRTPFIHKLDSDGNHLWAKQIENVTSGDGRGRCIEIDQNNEILVAGVFRSTFDFDPGPAEYLVLNSVSVYSVFLLKLDQDGNFIWVETIEPNGPIAVSTLTIDNENNYLLGGYFLGTILAPFGSTLPDLVGVNSTYNAYILKYTTPGELQWMKGIGGYGITTIYGVSAGLSGSYYVSGSFADSIDFDPGAGENFHVAIQNHDAFLMNLDGNGEYNWAQSISGGSSYASSMVTISDQGTIYLATTFNNVAKFNPMIAADITAEGDQDVLILKFNSLLELEAETKKDNTTHVYPNPTSGIIYINLQNFKADCTVELYDIAGNLLQSSFTKPALYALDLNEFSDGVYFIRLVSGDKLLTEKIVIE